MIVDNQMISRRQAAWILALDILAAGLFWLPSRLGGQPFRELMLTGILVLAILFLYYALSFYCLDRRNRMDGCRLKGRRLPGSICVFFILYYLLAIIYGVGFFYHVIAGLIPADYSYPVTVLFLLAAVVYGAGKGIEVRGRMAELMGWMVFVPFIILFAVGFWQAKSFGWPAELAEFSVRSGEHWQDILSGGYGALWFFLLGDHPYLLWRKIHGGSEEKKVPVPGMAGGCLMALAALFLTGLFFTPEGMEADGQPFGILLQMIRFPGNFISRYDVFFIMLWMMSFYIFIGGMLLEMVEMAMELSERSNSMSLYESGRTKRWLAAVFGILILILSGLAQQWQNFDVIFSRWMMWAGMPVCVALVCGNGIKWHKVEGNGVK